MLQIALREQLPIWTETPVRDLVVENGRVIGVVALRGGREVRVRALDGVLINVGGFSRKPRCARSISRSRIAGSGPTRIPATPAR